MSPASVLDTSPTARVEPAARSSLPKPAPVPPSKCAVVPPGPAKVVRKCHAVVFSGGSAFGLASAHGVVRWCAEHGIGFPTKVRDVPIVSAAVLFDLAVGNPLAYPDEAAGY